MKQVKKVVAAVLALALVVSGLYIVAPKAKEVQAQDAGTGTEGTLFAGYYVDEECTIPSNIAGGTEKYVDEGVLSVKMQPRKNADGTYDLRLVSTVDTLDYKNVGFKVSFDADGDGNFEDGNNGNEVDEVIEWTTATVLERIQAVDDNTVTYNYSPKVIDTKSEYFITGTLRDIKDATKDFLVESFWTTLDGTKVSGQSRWFSMDDMVSTKINIPVKMTQQEYESVALNSTVAVGSINATVAEQYFDGTYAHFNLTVTDKTALPSASVVTIGGKQVVYRNLESKGTGDTSWYDAYPNETEFVIATAADLYGLEAVQNANSGLSGKTVYMVADIALNDVKSVADWSAVTEAEATNLKKWTPVGLTNNGFAGTFDGQMHTISGLYAYYAKISEAAAVGLFGHITSNSFIRNLKLEDSYLQGGTRVGSVVGNSLGGKLEAIYNKATIISTSSYGNLAGGDGTGGMVGYVQGDTEIQNCWNAGLVWSNHNSGWAFTGGIVGNSSAKTTIMNCLNTGNIETNSEKSNVYIGGIAGGTYSNNGLIAYHIQSCLSAGTISEPQNTTNGVGAIVGRYGLGTGKESNNIGTTNARGTVEASTLYGADGWKSTLLNDDYWVAVEEGIPELKSFKDLSDKTVADVSNIMRSADKAWYNEAESITISGVEYEPGTAENPYVIYTEEEFLGLIELSQTNPFAGKTIMLGADLVLNEGNAADWATQAPVKTYQPISCENYTFQGNFDGNGKTISGLYISHDPRGVGLFGWTGANSSIQNLKLTNSYITSTKSGVGSIVGRCSANMTLSNVYSDAFVSAPTYMVGGLVGYVGESNVDIEACHFAGTVAVNTTQKAAYAGGIVGHGAGTGITISNCQFSGELSATTGERAYAGGILGVAVGQQITISNCLSTGTITADCSGSPTVGGILGATAERTGAVIAGTTGSNIAISNCLSTAAISNVQEKTGLICSVLGYGNSTISASYGIKEKCQYNYYDSSTDKYHAENQMTEAELIGLAGLSNTALNPSEGTSYWVAVRGSTPQLKAFQTIVEDTAE